LWAVVSRFWVETLGCPKNQVDSDKLVGVLQADGYAAAGDPTEADLVVVNTCAFVEEARQESIDTILAFSDRRAPGARLVVTGCMAERYRDELAEALPEVDLVAPFGVPVTIGRKPASQLVPAFDLLELPRPPASAPWAYVKVAEGCDRTCGFCAIPSFRGPQRSRSPEAVLAEVDGLGAREIVLVAQDLARYGRDQGRGQKQLVPLIGQVAERVDRVRLLYLYPSELDDALIDAVLATGVPYFDLSLQHVSRPLLRRMRRWGDDERFQRTIATIRDREPEAVLRSNFIVGYPGETEADHDALLAFVEDVRLDWCGFFAFSEEEGTLAAGQDGQVEAPLVRERLRELSELQDRVTAERRADLVGRQVEVLVDEPGVGRSYREAPEIDGVVLVADDLAVGELVTVEISASIGPDLVAT
jgi:ribosomal protein S12 methylthiotransferase